MRYYDAIILGSSPPLLSLAYRLASQGKKIIVLEKESVLGGAWATDNIFNIQDADSHCHVLVQDFRAYKLMEQALGIKLIVVEPQPIYLCGAIKLHYNNPLRYIVSIIEPLFIKKKYKSNPSVWDVKNSKLS